MVDAGYARRLKLRREAASISQRELSRLSGVKQPTIAAVESGTRLISDAARTALEAALRVRPTRLLAARRDEVLAVLRAHRVTNPRLFGSTAQGQDGPDSDVDLIVTFPPGSDIVDLLALEEELSGLLTVHVDVISAGSAGPVLDHAMRDSVPL